jgi:hypothetical protein
MPIASNVGMMVKNELERVWREAVVAYLCNVISLSVTGVNEITKNLRNWIVDISVEIKPGRMPNSSCFYWDKVCVNVGHGQ